MKTKKPVNVLISDGGMGDLLCSLVAVNYNVKNYLDIQFLVWVPDYMLDIAKHLLKGTSVRSYTQAKTKYNNTLSGITTAWNRSFHTPMRTHPVDYGFHVLTDKHIYNLNEKNYLQIRLNEIKLTKFQLPEKYVVLIASAAERVKEMPVNTMNELIDYVVSKGYIPVFLGKTIAETGVEGMKIKANEIDADYSKGINFLNKTNLLEASGIMSKAKAVIGMDGGLIHLAGSTDTYIVASYTLASPVHLAPIRNGSQTYKYFAIEPDLDVPNRYYQTNTNFNYDEDLRYFPGWKNVVKNITSDKFIKVLDNIL